MSTSTDFILRDIANELEKIRIILERAYPPAPGCRTVPNNSTVLVKDGKRYLQVKEDGTLYEVGDNKKTAAEMKEPRTKVDLVKNTIKENIEFAPCGIYFTRNLLDDPMATLMNGDEVQIDICYEYEYFEVFGLTDREQKEIDEFYWKTARENREADTPQTDLLVKTPRKSRESHEKNCETCRDKDAYDEWEGNCDECENGSMYTPQTDCGAKMKGADDVLEGDS